MTDWRYRAVCREEDPELFFPIGTTGPAELQIAEAKAVCRRCSVSDECLKWALETGQDAGVWGGMSEEERRLMHRPRIRVLPPRPAAPKICARCKRNPVRTKGFCQHCRAWTRKQELKASAS